MIPYKIDKIAFVDTEIDPTSQKVLDIGCTKSNGESLHTTSLSELENFLEGTQFLCGHNILSHDLKYIQKEVSEAGIQNHHIIDTLHFSPLLFPAKPYHALVKDDKLQIDDCNNPLNDALKAKDLFYGLVTAFHELEDTTKKIFYLLLKEIHEFGAFFLFVGFGLEHQSVEELIHLVLKEKICENADLAYLIGYYPVELAYCLALIRTNDRGSITPPWVLKNYPKVDQVMSLLRNRPCLTGCPFCDETLNPRRGLMRYFGFSTYRAYGGEPLQERAVEAAISNKSILAVFPTGGGKSITFQVPALMSGESTKGLTVVISPLQSLMKDQVDNLERKHITEAVTINGLLDPIERAKSFERVEDGSASLLYISPESLRSKTIERLLLGRKIARFVIDEAHCFSSWGHDFRVDYLYIGDFINSLQKKKNLEESIPVSCFTATAKQKVLEDIRHYFKNTLSLDLELFRTNTSRANLHYSVFERGNEEEKYIFLRNLIEGKDCPTIIYVARTHRASELAKRLTADGFLAKPFHGKMEAQEKIAHQNAFLTGEISIMVATSAFGMGVDKSDVGMVIHYDISDSLENYVQEAGRAGRDENMEAECYVLFNEEDLSKHFVLLNQTKLNIKEIQQVWKAIKEITRFRTTVSNSALEIARKAGWDDTVLQIENRVTTAIAALEEAGYLKRGQNMPRIFANSICSKNAQEAIGKINRSERFDDKQKISGVRIIKNLFARKSRKQLPEEEAETRVDYLCDHLGLVKEDVIRIIHLLREEGILADAKDLTAFINKGESKKRSVDIAISFFRLEDVLLQVLEEEEKTYDIKELNELAEEKGLEDISPNKVKTILNFWAIKNWIKRSSLEHSRNHLKICCMFSKAELREKLKKRKELTQFIIELLQEESIKIASKEPLAGDLVLVEFSVHELMKAYANRLVVVQEDISVDDVEDTLFYLSKIEAIKIEGGFLVAYNRLTIERTESDTKKRYKAEDYQKLQQFYEGKIQQIHIVGEYAKKMMHDYKEALQFVDDYFQLNYASFLQKYFKGSRQEEIKRNITPSKFRQLFGELSPTQLKIIQDKEAKHIGVLAGPGSGKTRILVHKLASLLLMEDVKHEQLLMLTFSRAAATEFKSRLIKLIGNAALWVDIKTFHSFCFDVVGHKGSQEKSGNIIKTAIDKIQKNDVEIRQITKTVLVIDEAQDMDADEFALVDCLMKQNEEMRVIAVGDDDQTIYEFRGASAEYLERLVKERNATKYELTENYRSKSNLVEFSNQFVQTIKRRLKETPISAHQTENGRIKLVSYESRHLIVPLVNDILSSELSGTTCILTCSNDEALLITGLLLKNGVSAKLIQSNEGFNLLQLWEIRCFLDLLGSSHEAPLLSEDTWEKAKKQLAETLRGSDKLEACLQLIRDFETTNPKAKYRSSLEKFIQESRLEDFYLGTGDAIWVSTMHKSKGREFDNVFLMLENIFPESDKIRRQLYVAMTRAKQRLVIHYRGKYLQQIEVENLEKQEDKFAYSPPDQLAMQLTFKDVWLDFFLDKQNLIDQLVSGQMLSVDNVGCCDSSDRMILRFSKQMVTTIETLQQQGYTLKEAKIAHIVYWKKENQEEETKIVLPELQFQKSVIS